MQVLMEIILFIASIVIIVAVLMQESKSDGVASLTAETNISGKGGKKSKDAVFLLCDCRWGCCTCICLY